MEILVHDLKELPAAAKQLLDFFSGEKIILFEGEMGAGKTTLIITICKELGAQDTASSPTYSIVNEYDYPHGKIFHFDFFRIKNETEAFDLGFEEYIYSGEYCFIEWPEKVENLWPPGYIKVVIENTEGTLRRIIASRITS